MYFQIIHFFPTLKIVVPNLEAVTAKARVAYKGALLLSFIVMIQSQFLHLFIVTALKFWSGESPRVRKRKGVMWD